MVIKTNLSEETPCVSEHNNLKLLVDSFVLIHASIPSTQLHALYITEIKY